MTFIHPKPLTAAFFAALVASAGLIAADWYVSHDLIVPAISAAQIPTLDGDMSDNAWKLAQPVEVLTRHGGDFGGSGETTVEVRAVHDDTYLYLAIEWDDPTRSLEYMPLFKDGGRWHSLQTRSQSAKESRFFDDRIAIMLAPSGLEMIGGAIHLGARPLRDAPASTTGRGLHFTAPGKLVDMWVWHAALGAMTDRIQDDYLGPPLAFTAEQMAGRARYLGGLGEDDPGRPVAVSNAEALPTSEDGAVLPRRLPRVPVASLDVAAIKSEAVSNDAPEHDAAWAVRATDTVPYSPQADAALPDGSILPGFAVDDTVQPGPHDVMGRGAWAGGHWVLELRRSLDGDAKDLPIKTGAMLWFAVFDHAQSRHTYHLRPLILELQ